MRACCAAFLVACAALGSGCDGDRGVDAGTGVDAAIDGSSLDGGAIDAAPAPDGGPDAASPDAGPDGGPDAATSDAAMAPDAGVDGGPPLHHVTVRLGGPGHGAVDGGPIHCDESPGAVCDADVPHHGLLHLEAVPMAGSRLAGWSVAGCATAPSCDVTVDADLVVEATFEPDPPEVRLSATDRDPLIRLRDDRLAADFYGDSAIRSDRAVTPGSGVFYFEAHRLTDDLGPFGFGVGTAALPVTGPSSYLGASDQSFGAFASGGMNYGGGWVGGFSSANVHYGFVVDYRGANPTVHFIATADLGAGPVPTVVRTQPMPAVVDPLYILLSGSKRTIGYEVEINPGNDTTNFPFHYDPATVLRAASLGDVADALVLGWGGTDAEPPDDVPVLAPSADLVVASGTPVTVTATATDTEDGDLTGAITWELLSTPYYAGRTIGSGGSFSFTPTAVGLHPARAWVRDSAGQLSEVVIEVRVSGPVAQYDPVRLAPDPLSGAGVVLSPDGLSARWTGLGKMGIRANQSNYGRFWYFEIIRLVPPRNQGGGLVVGDGDLNPYDWAYVPPSMSINNGGGVWRNIIWQSPWPDPDASTYDHYGFAVDYRGVHPIVYVILDDAVIAELYLDDVWTEIHPMLYGNPSATPDGSYDEAINFGATPFQYDPAAALVAHGVDISAFEAGWGDANLP